MANGHLSDLFADALVKAWLTKDVSLLPATYYIGLTLELPTDENGLGLIEPDVVEYARQPVVAAGASWVSMGVGSRSMETTNDLIYNKAITAWGEIKGYILYDSLVAGTFLGYGITNPFTVTAGMTPRLPAGAIVISQPA